MISKQCFKPKTDDFCTTNVCDFVLIAKLIVCKDF